MDRGHRRLTPEVVARVRELAADGLPLASIAAGCGVGYSSLRWWLKRARDGEGSDLELALLSAMQEGAADGERELLGRIRGAAAGEWKAAAWLLSHSPRWREHFSDAGYERRIERRTMALAVQALAAAGQAPEDERRVLLQFQAQGLGAAAPEAATTRRPEAACGSLVWVGGGGVRPVWSGLRASREIACTLLSGMCRCSIPVITRSSEATSHL